MRRRGWILAACGPPAPREAAARRRERALVPPSTSADTTVSAAARLSGPTSAVLRARIDSVFARFDRPG